MTNYAGFLREPRALTVRRLLDRELSHLMLAPLVISDPNPKELDAYKEAAKNKFNKNTIERCARFGWTHYENRLLAHAFKTCSMYVLTIELTLCRETLPSFDLEELSIFESRQIRTPTGSPFGHSTCAVFEHLYRLRGRSDWRLNVDYYAPYPPTGKIAAKVLFHVFRRGISGEYVFDKIRGEGKKNGASLNVTSRMMVSNEYTLPGIIPIGSKFGQCGRVNKSMDDLRDRKKLSLDIVKMAKSEMRKQREKTKKFLKNFVSMPTAEYRSIDCSCLYCSVFRFALGERRKFRRNPRLLFF